MHGVLLCGLVVGGSIVKCAVASDGGSDGMYGVLLYVLVVGESTAVCVAVSLGSVGVAVSMSALVVGGGIAEHVVASRIRPFQFLLLLLFPSLQVSA